MPPQPSACTAARHGITDAPVIVAGLGQCSLDHIAVVDEFPIEDAKLETPGWEIQGGGPVATALVALSRFGIGTRFMGLVGDDAAGEIIRTGLREESVECRHLISRPRSSSQIAFIIANRARGTRTIVWSRPSGGVIRPEEVPHSFLQGCSLVHLDGLMAEASLAAARMARALGVRVSYDAGSVREGSLHLAELCDYVVCAENFSRQFAGGDHKETLRRIADMGVITAVVTLGPKGSLAFDGKEFYRQPAFQVPVVDTTGAGDIYHAGFIYGVLHEWPLPRTLSFASAAAAIACTRAGGRSAIPSVGETLALMEEAMPDKEVWR